MERPVVLAYYYIANNKIMQAPSGHQVTHARLQRCTFALQQGFAKLQADLEPLSRAAQQLAKQAAREEQTKLQQQQQRQQSQGQQQHAPGQPRADLPTGGLARQEVTGTGQDGALAGEDAATATAGGKAVIPYTVQPYAATVDLQSPSLGTLRAPLAAPLPEVMAAAAAEAVAGSGGGGGGSGSSVPIRRHLTDVDRARWNKLDRILSHQFSSLQRIKYTALPPEYLQKLHQQMYGMPTPQPPPQQPGPTAGTPANAVAQ